jgi:hypothetical protein
VPDVEKPDPKRQNNDSSTEEKPPDDLWEEPIPLGVRSVLPAFPTHVFPGYISAMVKGVAEEVQVPEDLAGGLALAALGTAAGGRAEVSVRGQWREPLNVHMAIAMPPGGGKSPAFRLMMRPVFAAEARMREDITGKIKEIQKEQREGIARAEAARKLAKTAEEIAVAMDAAQMAEEMEIPRSPRLTADDVTPAQASTILFENGGRLAVLSAEGTFFEQVMGRYSNGKPDLELVLKGHAGDRLMVDRRGREEFVERPSLTLGICLQPQLLQDVAAKKEMVGRGAVARLLLSVPEDRVGYRSVTPDLLDETIIRNYTETLMRLVVDLNEWTDPAIIPLTAGALKFHTEWRAEIEPRMRRGTGDLEALREWASKLGGQTARLAGLLHLATNPLRGTQVPIAEQTMVNAIELARYYVLHAMAAFGVMRAHPLLHKAQMVLDWIREKKVVTVKPRDVLRAMHRRLDDAAEVSAVLRLLEDHAYVRLAPSISTGGRRPIVYDVNPKVR